MSEEITYTAFAAERLLASGPLKQVLLASRAELERDPQASLLIFDDRSGFQVEFDLRGTPDEVLARELPSPPRAGPGRPKLGVSSREVSLLPRHWDWLEQQPNGVSAALRRLVEEAIKRAPDRERARRARDATSRVMTAMAGNLRGYEEASRALFAGDAKGFSRFTRAFPKDIRNQLQRLAAPSFPGEPI